MEDISNHEKSSKDINPITSSSNINYDINNYERDDTSNLYVQSNMNKSCVCDKEEKCSCKSEDSKVLSHSYVYAIGNVVYRFPSKSLEMELAQVIGNRSEKETKGLTREEISYQALIDPTNRYLARQLCYVMKIENIETYILIPTDPLDIDKFAQAVRPIPDPRDIDVIIGRRGPIASPETCNGLMLPIVMVDQIYSFDRQSLIKAIPRKTGTSNEQFSKTSSVLFNQILQIADNAGATNEHRALNYLAVRYEKIYEQTQLMQDQNYSFTGVEVRPSRLSGLRNVVDVIISYENRSNRAVRKWFIRVDVTEEFPFLVSPIQEYFER